ncbi:MAG: flagellar basal body-associated FliL family protein [Clostridia bacterium]|jgi:flagellar basal body-associated protein FliL
MKNLLIIVITVVLTVALTFVILIAFPDTNAYKTPEPSPTPTETAEEEEPPLFKYVTEEAFITNMKDSNGFVQASFMIEITNEEDLLYIQEHNYILTDTIINVLRNTTEEEYLKDDIQQMLRERIKKVLSTALGIDSIQNVFFLELIIQ